MTLTDLHGFPNSQFPGPWLVSTDDSETQHPGGGRLA